MALDLFDVLFALYLTSLGHFLLVEVALLHLHRLLALVFLVLVKGLLPVGHLLQQESLPLHLFHLLVDFVLLTLEDCSFELGTELLTHVQFVLPSLLMVFLDAGFDRLQSLHHHHATFAFFALVRHVQRIAHLGLRLKLLSGECLGLQLHRSVDRLFHSAFALGHSSAVLLPRLLLELLLELESVFAPPLPLAIFLV